MRINVTQEDIDAALAGSFPKSLNCPIAKALRRHGVSHVGCDRSSVLVCGGARVFLPPDARDFIYQFDNRQPVQPFSFDFEIPQEAIKP